MKKCNNCKYVRTLWYWENNEKKYGSCCVLLQYEGVVMDLDDADKEDYACECYIEKTDENLVEELDKNVTEKQPMQLKIKPCYAYCTTEEFEINGVEADYTDFGHTKDIAPHCAPDYGCGNRQFIPKPATQEILDKYHIDIDDYNKICEELDCLSFGRCTWCV